jgi:hypothetical protein
MVLWIPYVPAVMFIFGNLWIRKKAIMHLQWPEFRSMADYLKMDDDKFWDEHIRAIDSLT